MPPGFLTTYKSLHIVAHSLRVVVTSCTSGSSVGTTVSFCLRREGTIRRRESCPLPATQTRSLIPQPPPSPSEVLIPREIYFPPRGSPSDSETLKFGIYLFFLRHASEMKRDRRKRNRASSCAATNVRVTSHQVRVCLPKSNRFVLQRRKVNKTLSWEDELSNFGSI